MANSHENENMSRIVPLGKSNYDTWKIHMEALLDRYDRTGYAKGEIKRPEVVAEDQATIDAAAKWDRVDRKTKADIVLAIAPSELKTIQGCNTSNEIWAKLESTFQSSGTVVATLLKSLISCKLREEEEMLSHVQKFTDINDKLKKLKIIVPDELLSILLLYSVPETFENFQRAMERDELPTFDQMQQKLLDKSLIRNNKDEVGVSNANFRQKFKPSNNERIGNAASYVKCKVCF